MAALLSQLLAFPSARDLSFGPISVAGKGMDDLAEQNTILSEKSLAIDFGCRRRTTAFSSCPCITFAGMIDYVADNIPRNGRVAAHP
ncbi:MAG: hypothetical protein A4E45_00177 [Methanosaeta sp. PtaB.Bin039]|nr:MAG: hypothetical protein A4E45_00177 [Methanosaeta sp. PtaB.Bin039]OPY45199.1 MAG: hypothetical protein A4E47_01053 [Methanosaeta sp. PtaU1.Bin028]